MTLTELRYIVAVAREKHFGRAARSCHISQPTLSVSVKKLEEELGVQIFERRANEVALTPTGERIVQQAQQALESADAVKSVAQMGKDQLAGPLKIGAIYTVGPYLFPELIPVLHKKAAEMPLIIEENYTSVLSERLKNGELDVIVIALSYDEPGIVTLPLYKEPFVVLLPFGHPLTQRKLIKSSHLENETVLLLGAGHCFRQHVLDACPSCVPRSNTTGELSHTVEGGSLETIRHMVLSGLGVTVLPCTAADADRYSQRLLEIRRFANPVPSRTIALAWRASYPRPKVIDVLREAIKGCSLSCVSRL
jgi:LysR family hydrogen peroxide-inducible transcriptional activator